MSRAFCGAIAAARMLIDQPEPQRAGNRRRFDQLDRNRVAETMRCRTADEGASRLLKPEILFADVARRDKPVRAGFVELDKQAGAKVKVTGTEKDNTITVTSVTAAP